MVSECVLKVQGITKQFEKKKVLKGVSFDIFEREIIGIIGSSGSGKTTLLRTIAGFLAPEDGDVKFRREVIRKRSKIKEKIMQYDSVFKEQRLAKNLFGFASQSPSFYEKLTVRENLEYFGSLYGLSSKALKSNIDILLALMDLKQAEKTLGEKLSGGMGRRLDIACALIHDPEILILDEPTSDLDPVLREHIWSLVQKINKRGTTIMLASHHLNEVEHFCSRIAIINEGRLLEFDTPAKIKTKHAESQRIIVQSYPGNYGNIAKSLRKPGGKVSDIHIKGSELVIFSDQPKQVLHELLHILESADEELIDVKVSRPGLDELFMRITKDGSADGKRERKGSTQETMKI